MIPLTRWGTLALLTVTVSLTIHAKAQAGPTASQPLALSAFGAGTGTFTGLGKNVAVTAGADLSFLTYHKYRPVLEVRGTYPVNNGNVAGEKDVLAGLRVERHFGQLHPYINFLVGRGEIDYKGYQIGDFIYLKTTSTVYSPGVGFDYDVREHWAAKVELQIQRWDTPVRASGDIYSKAISIGAVYRFDFNPHHRRQR